MSIRCVILWKIQNLCILDDQIHRYFYFLKFIPNGFANEFDYPKSTDFGRWIILRIPLQVCSTFSRQDWWKNAENILRTIKRYEWKMNQADRITPISTKSKWNKFVCHTVWNHSFSNFIISLITVLLQIYKEDTTQIHLMVEQKNILFWFSLVQSVPCTVNTKKMFLAISLRLNYFAWTFHQWHKFDDGQYLTKQHFFREQNWERLKMLIVHSNECNMYRV